MPPSTQDVDRDRSSARPLVVGPIRGFWPRRNSDSNTWIGVIAYGPLCVALAFQFLEPELNWLLGEWVAKALILLVFPGAYLAFFGFWIWVIFRASAWGEAWWRIDEAGVTRSLPTSEPIFLAWDDVEEVRLGEQSVLRGRGVQVSFPSGLRAADRIEVARRIREHLAEDFDLEPRSRASWSMGSFLHLLLVSLVWTAIALGTSLGPVLAQAFGGPRIGWIGMLAFLGWMIVFARFMRKELRRDDARQWISKRPPEPSSPVGFP